MLCLKHARLANAYILVFCLVGAAGAQTRLIRGQVKTADDDPVKRAEVSIDGAVVDTTADTGDFHVPLQPPLRPGFPVTFGVDGWIVVDPCSLDRGRIYLPDPDAEAMKLKVLRPSDRRLLAGRALTCMLETKDSRLPSPKKTVHGTPAASLLIEVRPTLADENGLPTVAPRAELDGILIPGALVRAAYHPAASAAFVRFAARPKPHDSQPAADAFLADQAKALGFKVSELSAALSAYSLSAHSPYEKGLAASYEGRYADAVRLIQQSIDSNPQEIERYVPLAYSEFLQQHYPAAEAALRKVITIHPDDPLLLLNLGTVLGIQGKGSESERAINRSLVINKQTFGANSPETAYSLSIRGTLYESQARYQAAEQDYKDALRIDEKALDPNDADLARDYANLGTVLTEENRYHEADPLFRHALQIDQAVFGEDHPAIVFVLFDQAEVDHALGKDSEAEQLYLHALKILDGTGGQDTQIAAYSLVGLGSMYMIQGRYPEAMQRLARALKITENALGPDDPELEPILAFLGDADYRQRNFAGAESYYRRAITIDGNSLLPEVVGSTRAMGGLANLYWAEGRFAEAIAG